MAGWTCPDRETIEWDGTIKAKKFKGDGSELTNLPSSEAFPVNSVFFSVVSTNPSTLLGYGTWSAIGAGLYIVGVPSGGTAETTIGTALTNSENRAVGQHTHVFTGNELPSHTHSKRDSRGASAGSNFRFTTSGGIFQISDDGEIRPASAGTPTGTNADAGSVAGTNAPHIYLYMWKRTA